MRVLVGKNVRRLREARGLSQEELAEKSGFGQNYLSDLERGKRNPTIVTLYHIAEALSVTPAALVSPEEQSV